MFHTRLSPFLHATQTSSTHGLDRSHNTLPYKLLQYDLISYSYISINHVCLMEKFDILQTSTEV